MRSVAILETGSPPRHLRPRFGSYSDMLSAMLGAHRVGTVFDVTAGQFPESPGMYGALVITGSAAGVHDKRPWIGQLSEFLLSAKGRTKLVGICFGHQILAHTFGGRVVRAAKGWGEGLHTYQVINRMPWMDDAKEVAIAVSHQDQVDICPDAAVVVAGSEFTPFGILAYQDQPAISFQCHPEFTPEFATALTTSNGRTGPELAGALSSLREPNDCPRVATWIHRFLDQQ
jgi:GMP synthase-like glutamine amidotransferase